MMYVVVYLSAKLGQVYGKGLFAIIRDQFPRLMTALASLKRQRILPS
jgi:Mn2+/Fe2+ NRAMP family transporter